MDISRLTYIEKAMIVTIGEKDVKFRPLENGLYALFLENWSQMLFFVCLIMIIF